MKIPILFFLALTFQICVLAVCPLSLIKTSTSDFELARRTEQSGYVGGYDPSSISASINNYAKRSGWPMRVCTNFTNEELKDLLRTLFCHHSNDLQAIYKSGHDARARRFSTLEDFEQAWYQEEVTSQDIDSLRDAKCADVLRHWAHHVPNDAKSLLMKQNITIPTLPTYQKDKHKVDAFNCITGHNMKIGVESDHQWPHWPAEAHYYGTGHNAYPFWLGPDGQGGSGPIEVWYSETKGAEKYYHQTCGMREAGYSSDVPCYHLFVKGQPNPMSYLYTKAEDFCCLSNPPQTSANPPREHLAAPQSDFMDAMTLTGTINIKTEYYSGSGKNYLLTLPSSEPVTYFWYVTTPEGKPLQQGEGGKSPQDDSGRGIQIWHNYNVTSFQAMKLDDSIFAVPQVCTRTTHRCPFP